MASEWKHISLREAGVSLIDCVHKTPPVSPTGYPYIAIPQLKNGRLDLAGVRLISPEHFAEWTRKANPQSYDVILSRRCNPGETALVPPGFQGALGQNLVLLRADGKRVFPPFLRWLVRSPACWEQVGTFINVGAVFDSLKCADIPNFRLPLPPLDAQKAIAHILSSLDDKIELNQQMNRTLEGIARALFKSWFIDFDPVRAKLDGRQPAGMDAETAALFPAEFEDGGAIGQIPKGWRVGTLKDCCERVENGGTPKRSEPNYWEPGTIPWLTSGEVRQSIVTATENFISEKGLANSSAKLWAPGTTVVAMYGATAGQVCLLAKELCTNQACCGLIPAEYKQFFIYLQTSNSVELLAQQARGSAQQNLSQKLVADFPTVIPSDPILKIFDKSLKPIFEKWIANLEESKSLAFVRDALLPKLLSGEIRVKEVEKTVAEVA